MDLLFREVVLGAERLVLELREGGRYLLRYGDAVEYRDGRRVVRGRAGAYEFRSVEQLRYDFERDVRALPARHKGRGG
jgi:hypothetical protein